MNENIITKRGVYKDITKSDFKLKIDDVTLYFTSQANLKRYIRKLPTLDLLQYVTHELSIKNIKINSIIELYENIEKRGFRVEWKGVIYSCRENMDITIEITHPVISKNKNNLSLDKKQTQ